MQKEKRIHQGRVASLQQSRHVAFGRKAVTTKVTELAKSAIQVTYYLETFQDTRAKRERMMTVREESENNNEKRFIKGVGGLHATVSAIGPLACLFYN